MKKKNVISTSGLNLDYLELLKRGENKALFFIHGFPDDAYIWKSQFEYFKDKSNILAPFVPNITSQSAEVSINEIARAYIEILKSYDLDNVVIISHDLGGPIANEMCDQLKIIKKSIFINAPSIEQMRYRLNDLSQLRKSWYIFFFQASKISKYYIKANWNRISKKIIAQNNLPNDHKIDLEIFLKDMHLYKIFFKHLKSLSKDDLKITQTQCKFLWSQFDPFLNIPSDQELQKLFMSHSLEVIPFHHWPMIESPNFINKKIEELL